LLKLFPADVAADIQTRFKDVIAKRRFNENDVAVGREYVKVYIAFLHYLEHLHAERRPN
jgi:hypothetical protein